MQALLNEAYTFQKRSSRTVAKYTEAGASQNIALRQVMLCLFIDTLKYRRIGKAFLHTRLSKKEWNMTLPHHAGIIRIRPDTLKSCPE